MVIKLIDYRTASDDEISSVERQFGISFPKDYREFLLKYDGASPEENVFENDESICVNRFIPISELKKRSSLIEGLPKDAVPIAEDPCGNYIYINISDFKVHYWDHEIESGDKEIAASFEEFFKKLIPFNINSIQFKPGQVKSVWVDPKFKPDF